MLYEHWRQLVRDRGAELAMVDAATSERWTFAELARLAEQGSPIAVPAVYPQGQGVEFILGVLRGWRDQVLVCPLETGQTLPPLPPPGRSVVHVKTTSATTGTPRQVLFTAAQLKADADHIVATMGLRPAWPTLGCLSMAHSYGFSNLVLPLLLHGIPLVLTPSPLPEVVRRAAATFPEMNLPAVPALWHTWHEAGAIPDNLRLAISAGAPLSVDLERRVFATSGLKLHNFYGSTECGGIAYDRSSLPREDDTFVGTAMEGVKHEVASDGCLCVHGPNVGLTYWPEPEEALEAGRFRTSDLAELREGRVHLRGRLSDLINVAGRKLSPVTIEQVLSLHPAVAASLVFGIPSGQDARADAIVAVVAPKGPVSGEELRHYLLDRLAAWQVPRDWWFVDSLGANQRGKISRAEWRGRYQSEFPRRVT